MSKVTFRGSVMFPSEYLAASDLQGKDITVTIESIAPKMLQMKPKPGRDGKKEQPKKEQPKKEEFYLVRFEGKKKEWLLNTTNAESIRYVTGIQEATDWPGQRITIFPTRVSAWGEIVDAIRVRETKPPPKVTPPDADELAAASR